LNRESLAATQEDSACRILIQSSALPNESKRSTLQLYRTIYLESRIKSFQINLRNGESVRSCDLLQPDVEQVAVPRDAKFNSSIQIPEC